jgi:hypothetical protein
MLGEEIRSETGTNGKAAEAARATDKNARPPRAWGMADIEIETAKGTGRRRTITGVEATAPGGIGRRTLADRQVEKS